MSTSDLNTTKVDLVRYILNEADEAVIEKLMCLVRKKEEAKPKSLAVHLGKLKRGIDGLAYQKAIRNEWD